MTIGSTAPRNDYVGTGAVSVYSYTFRIWADTDLEVRTQDVAGNITLLTPGANYSVTGVGNRNGGTVVLTSALASGALLNIRCAVDEEQQTDLRNQGSYFPDVVEDQFDRIVRMVQQLRDVANRSLQLPEVDLVSGALANAVARANKTLGFDSTGAPTVLTPTVGSAAAVLTDLANSSNVAFGDALVAYKHIYTGAVARTVHLRFLDFPLNVKDFGATGDGSTDDAAAIQLCIDAAIAIGGTVYFPRGTYTIGTMLLVSSGGVRVCGEGKLQVLLKRKAGSTIASLLHLGQTAGSAQINNVEVSDMTFDGNTTTGGGSCTDATAKVRNCGNSVFRRLKFQNGANGGFRTDTSTVSVTTNQAFNEYDDLYAVGNTGGVGLKFQGEKDSRFGKLFIYGQTGDGVEFKAFKYDGGTLAETTECIVDSILVAGCIGSGVVFDQCEKFNVNGINSNNNGGYGVRFKSTLLAASGNGGNSVVIGNLISRNDALGGIAALEADTCAINSAQIGNALLIGFGSALNARGIHLQGVAGLNFGRVKVVGFLGDAVKIENGLPFNVAGDSIKVTFDTLILDSNGNGSATTNHGLSIQDSSSRIHIGNLITSNGFTTGTNYEVLVGAGAGPIFIGTAEINAAAGGNEINVNTTGQLFMGPSEIRGMRVLPLRDGVTAPANNVSGFGLLYIDAADGDAKIRFSDGFVRTFGADS